MSISYEIKVGLLKLLQIVMPFERSNDIAIIKALGKPFKSLGLGPESKRFSLSVRFRQPWILLDCSDD